MIRGLSIYLCLRPIKSLATSLSLCCSFCFFSSQKSITAPLFILWQHFREHLDKLFAQGIGMLDVALTEAFSLLRDVSNPLTFADTTHLIPVTCKDMQACISMITDRAFSQSLKTR